jgi:uncharacterized LabA/DUF88 family protein
MAFVDGENLLKRYESMAADGWGPRLTPGHFGQFLSKSTHQPGRLVWNPFVVREVGTGPLLRVNYYTTAVGDANALETLELDIAALTADLVNTGMVMGAGSRTNLVPQVFKKQQRGQKTKSVDINLCVDVLTQAYQSSVDDIVIVSGDGDFAPLIRQTMSAGKRVHIAALSSGLSPRLRSISDHFIDLDPVFFESNDKGVATYR